MINTLLGINRQIERIEKIFEEISVKNVPNFMKMLVYSFKTSVISR